MNLRGSFSQWSADNIDHNICIIDGRGTLQRMGIVVSTTPGTTLGSNQKPENATALQTISVIPYDLPRMHWIVKSKNETIKRNSAV